MMMNLHCNGARRKKLVMKIVAKVIVTVVFVYVVSSLRSVIG
jgi:hypothetical protein